MKHLCLSVGAVLLLSVFTAHQAAGDESTTNEARHPSLYGAFELHYLLKISSADSAPAGNARSLSVSDSAFKAPNSRNLPPLIPLTYLFQPARYKHSQVRVYGSVQCLLAMRNQLLF